MKIIIYAGGIGSRLWPLSRENSPKQFDKIFNNKSTIQLALERVAPVFGMENIFIQTVAPYKEIIKEQIQGIKDENILIEPARRNLGPAVCFTMLEFAKRNFSGPVAILWADHLMERVSEFTNTLKLGEKLINKEKNRIIFLAERPRFANNNLGWMQIGKKIGEMDGMDYYSFSTWSYKPSTEECGRMYRSGEHYWNPGYFISSIEFLLDRYQRLSPEIYDKVKNNNYSEAEAIHFDRAIIEKLDSKNALVIKTNMGWSDPGTLYALKEALEDSSEANVLYGNVETLRTKDSLIYNFDKNKLIAGVGLKGMVVVNTADALVIVPKDEVVHITELVAKMREREDMKKYL